MHEKSAIVLEGERIANEKRQLLQKRRRRVVQKDHHFWEDLKDVSEC